MLLGFKGGEDSFDEVTLKIFVKDVFEEGFKC